MRVGERIRSKVVIVVVVDQLEAGGVGGCRDRGRRLEIILPRTSRAVNYLGSRCHGYLELSEGRFQSQ